MLTSLRFILGTASTLNPCPALIALPQPRGQAGGAKRLTSGLGRRAWQAWQSLRLKARWRASIGLAFRFTLARRAPGNRSSAFRPASLAALASFRRNARPTRPGSTPPSRARARLGMGAAGDSDNYLPYFSDCATQTPIVAPLRAIPQAERVEGKRPDEARRFSCAEAVFGAPPQSTGLDADRARSRSCAKPYCRRAAYLRRDRKS